MMTNNSVMYSIKILGEIARDFLFFPLWWYSRGLVMIITKTWEFVQNRQRSLALIVWVKNIFKPMYGQYDWQGLLISFFIRSMQIIFRSLIMFFWILVSLAFLVIWAILPFFVFYQIIFQLFI